MACGHPSVHLPVPRDLVGRVTPATGLELAPFTADPITLTCALVPALLAGV